MAGRFSPADDAAAEARGGLAVDAGALLDDVGQFVGDEAAAVGGLGRELALAVRHRAWNTVGVEPYAAHAEFRARAKASDRQLQILGIVLPILRRDTRDHVERLRQVHLRLSLRNRLLIDAIDRDRQLIARGRYPRGRDDDGCEFG